MHNPNTASVNLKCTVQEIDIWILTSTQPAFVFGAPPASEISVTPLSMMFYASITTLRVCLPLVTSLD